MKKLLLLRAVAALTLLAAAGTALAADDAALNAQVEALRTAIASQRAQLEAQAKLLEAQQAQLEALTRRLEQPGAAATETRKIAAPEAPKVTLTNNRPTITAADGKSSFAVRANVQLDGAMYGEDKEGPLATDFRRGSVGGTPNRENNAARDFSDGFYFRRVRFGVEGIIASDFNYRLLLELGGSGTEGPTRINDAWIAYTGLAPFTFQLGAFAPPANMDDGTTPEDLPFLERASASELSRSLGGADGRIGLGLKANGSRWMSAFTLTTRTVSDAEVFDGQLAAVGRAGGLIATSGDYNVHLGASGTYVFSPPDQGSSGAPPRHGLRFRDRPEIRVDSVRLIDTGAIDAAHASVLGLEFGANWKSFYLQGEHFWFDVERRGAAALPDPDFTGYYLQGSWMLTGESRRYNPVTGSFQNPRPREIFSRAGGAGAWEFAARYSNTNLNFQEGQQGAATVPGSVRGGEQNVLTLGVNWYLNPNFKVMMNYLLIDVDRLNPAGPDNTAPFGASPATPPIGVEIGQDLNVIAIRSQYSF
ncbi:MAG TPA: porin [Steroidobacteraceae bacterium]|nr:porin [Steroidobacteraceae bacterium]